MAAACERRNDVAVSTANLALGDLGEDHIQAGSAAHKLADPAYLLAANVVELEHSDVPVSTVDAALLEQRMQDCPSIRNPRLASTADVAKVTFIVIEIVLSLTVSAVRVQSVARAVRLVELRLALGLLAAVTDLHGRQARFGHRHLT